MSSMAVSRSGDGHSHSRQQSLSNRQVSLYASRLKAPTPPLLSPRSTPSAASNPRRERSPTPLSQLPPLPISPRWDSLSNSSHVLLHSPTSPQAPKNGWYEQQPQPQPHYHQSTQLQSGPFPGHDPAGNPPEAHHGLPLTSKSSYGDIRAPDTPAVENFSRPRKPSIRQGPANPVKLQLAYLPPSDLMPEMNNVSPSAPSWQRPRRPSVSSSTKSSYTYASSPAFSPTSEHFGTRARNGPAPPIASARPPVSYHRIDSAVSVPTTSGPAPWMGGDELRSSFRSQLTSSTAPGTTLTERSSVLTKASSVASLYANADEPSLEDVMGMYERGFCDDDDDQGTNNLDNQHNNDEEEEYYNSQDYHQPQDSFYEDAPEPSPTDENLDFEPRPDMRPRTASPEPAPTTGLDDSDIESVPPLPSGQTALDAEIRQSKMLFSSLAFTSTVPAVSHNHDLDVAEKRDSSKTVGSEPSVESDRQPKSTYMSPSAPNSRSPSPSPARMPAPPPEEPGSRDRYGFKKENHFITRKQYDAWDKGYSQYLARRRRKWIGYLKDSALMTDQPNRFPAPNAKTKRFVRKGIPPDWRGAAWFYYAGGPAILAKHAGLYDKLLQRKAKHVDIEAIERDLHRTFPDNILFKPSASNADMLDSTTSSERASQSTLTGSSSDGSGAGASALEGEPPIISSLRRVLLAFSVYNPRIGYCQSLNFIAGLLLLFVKTEEQTFWLLNVITHIYLPGTHEMSLEGSKVDLSVLMTELRDSMPSVWDKIGSDFDTEPMSRPMTSKSLRRSPRPPLLKRKDTEALSSERLPPITLCMTAWFMSCYIGTLPIESTLRVWDVFFYEGSKTLFRVALGIFKVGESEIKSVSDPMEMFGVVQSMPRRMIDVNKLFDTCFKRRNGFSHLSQDVIEERRQERREQSRQDLQRERGKTANNVEMGRKGTLFGRKK